jgi:hypothetical protein
MASPLKGQQSAECRKTCGKGAKRTQILAMGCSTPRLGLGAGVPSLSTKRAFIVDQVRVELRGSEQDRKTIRECVSKRETRHALAASPVAD